MTRYNERNVPGSIVRFHVVAGRLEFVPTRGSNTQTRQRDGKSFNERLWEAVTLGMNDKQVDLSDSV